MTLNIRGKVAMENFTIVKMKTENEIIGKAYVHYHAWHETYSELVNPEYLKTFTFEMCEKIARGQFDNILIAKIDNKVIGFVGFGAYREEKIDEYGEIYSIYVLKEYHGTKVGYQLMNAAMEKLSDYKHITVWVLKGNERAIKFYKRYGFVFDGTEQEMILGTPNTKLRMIYKGQ